MPYFHQVFQPDESPYYDTYYRGDAQVSIKKGTQKAATSVDSSFRSDREEYLNVDLARSKGEIED